MTGPAYRNTARWHFEPAPRPPMAHPAAFVPHAHREPAPEPLWAAILVYAGSIVGAGVVGLLFLWATR